MNKREILIKFEKELYETIRHSAWLSERVSSLRKELYNETHMESMEAM